MYKLMYGWRDHPDLGAEASEAHYRQHHMVLARKAFDGVDGFRALVYNRVRRHFVNDYNQRASIERESDLDAILELYFDSREQLEAAFAWPELQLLFDDHVNFMACDVPANVRVYEVDEEVFFGAKP